MLNETPAVAEISYFFSPPLRLLILLFDCTNLPSHRARLKLSLLYLFLSASTKRCQALTLLATQKATGERSGGGGTGTE